MTASHHKSLIHFSVAKLWGFNLVKVKGRGHNFKLAVTKNMKKNLFLLKEICCKISFHWKMKALQTALKRVNILRPLF